MAEHSQLPREKVGSTEKFSTSNQTVSLQTRLILGGNSLSPKKTDLEKVSADELTQIKPETFEKIGNASTNERASYWEGKGSYDQQLESWVNSLVAFMGNPQFTQKEASAL